MRSLAIVSRYNKLKEKFVRIAIKEKFYENENLYREAFQLLEFLSRELDSRPFSASYEALDPDNFNFYKSEPEPERIISEPEPEPEIENVEPAFPAKQLETENYVQNWDAEDERIEEIKEELHDYNKMPKTEIKAEPAPEPVKELPKIEALFGAEKFIMAGDEKIPAKYAIVELKDIIQSHDPFSYSKNPKYPAHCQTRDYADKATQVRLELNAQDYQADYVLIIDPTGVNGPPIITYDGITLGGNSRVMTLKRMERFNHQQYIEKYYYELLNRAAWFGIDSDDIKEQFRTPALVRVVDVNMQRCAFYSNALQKGQGKEYDETTEAIGFASQLDESEALVTIGKIFESSEQETFAGIMGDVTATRQIIDVLRKVSIIDNQNAPSWLDETGRGFSQKGKDLLEYTLLAAVLPDKNLIKTAKSYSGKILKVIPLFIRMRNLPGDWNLIPNVQEAIQHEHARRMSNNMTWNDYVNQISFDAPEVGEKTKLVWYALENAGINQFKVFIKGYINIAESSISGDAMFQVETTPIEVLREFINRLKKAEEEEKARKKSRGMNDDFDELSGLGDYVYEEPKNDLPDLPNTTEILNNQYRAVPLKLERTKKLFGNLLDDANVFVYGPQGQGKSTFVINLAQDLAMNGKVLYVLAEEPINTRLAARLRWQKINSPNIFYLPSNNFDDITKYIGSGDFKFVIIDSHNKLENATQNEIINLLESYEDVSFVIVSRNDKENKSFKGDGNWSYEVDTVVRMSDGAAILEKHRDRDDESQDERKLQVLPTKIKSNWRKYVLSNANVN